MKKNKKWIKIGVILVVVIFGAIYIHLQIRNSLADLIEKPMIYPGLFMGCC